LQAEALVAQPVRLSVRSSVTKLANTMFVKRLNRLWF